MPTSEEIQAAKRAREARREALNEAAKKQREIDMFFINELEEEYGDTNVAIVEAPYSEGLPVLGAVRIPKPVEFKRYQDRMSGKRGKQGDPMVAARELGAVCVIYPQGEVLEKFLSARQAIQIQLGSVAANLATGDIVAQGEG